MADEASDSTPHDRSARGVGRNLARGIAMGVSDAIPGVSGGTIALILGFYERFIDHLAAALRGLRHPQDATARRGLAQALWFLVPLGAGIGSAMLLALKLLVGDTHAINAPLAAGDAEALRQAMAQLPGLLLRPDSAPVVFAFFFGLVLLSIAEPWQRRRSRHRADVFLALSGAIVAAIIALSPAAAGSSSPLAVIFAGALAISVMLLPGISGSLALLLIGMYQPIAAAAAGFLKAPFGSDGLIVVCFLLGMLLGLAAFVPLLRRLLRSHHDRTMPVLTGLMAGSLVALWPWKVHYLPQALPVLGPMGLAAPTGAWWWPLIAAVAGAAVILAAQRFAPQPDRPA